MQSMYVYIVLFVAGCSYDWTSTAPAPTLVGAPLQPGQYTKLNALPASHSSLVIAADGSPWAGFCEFRGVTGSRGACTRLHLARIDGAPGDELLEGDILFLTNQNVFVIHFGMNGAQSTVTTHDPGDPRADTITPVPSAPPSTAPGATPPTAPLLDSDPNGLAFLYWVRAKSTTSYSLYRAGALVRTIPIPSGVDPTAPQKTMGFLFTADASLLVVRDPDGTTTAYSTTDGTTVSFGVLPPALAIDDAHHALLSIDADQFLSHPLDGSAAQRLGPGFDPSTLELDSDGNGWYADASGLWRMPLDGSAPPSLVQPGAARLLALGPHGEVVYSTDPGDRYVGGAGDGWIGGWRFMERGLRVRFDDAGTRIDFLEHAARVGTVGDLTTVPLPATPGGVGGPPTLLALNVHDFHELHDGRVPTVEAHPYAGTWTRLVVIDEAHETARFMLPGADRGFLVPHGSAMVVDVTTADPSGFDIDLAPIPPQ